MRTSGTYAAATMIGPRMIAGAGQSWTAMRARTADTIGREDFMLEMAPEMR